MSLETEELIARARRGNPSAWEALVRLHEDGVFRFAYLQMEEASEAEDLAQETFLRAFRSLDRFDSARSLRPWLLSITANLARNRRRSLGRYWAALKRYAAEKRRAEPSQTAAHPRSEQGRAADLRAAIGRLEERDREVILLQYFLEMSTAEIAQALEVAEGTVKSRSFRARRRLQQILERENPAWLDQSQE